MATYLELKQKARELDELIQQARCNDFNAVLEEVRLRVAEFDFTPADVFGNLEDRRRKRSNKRPRYRDPVSGMEWSGWGRQPFWIKGKDRKQFEIRDKSQSDQS
ncbi:H-NS histone family protein [Caballeronia sp. LjRoot31]|jgi:DNA-binding protein H-NS|uniref:H-NS histone family protein n=1 Tax=Caballeronia sp. LjRoot31 TaxID=3342324 RepID=UPI003ECF950C